MAMCPGASVTGCLGAEDSRSCLGHVPRPPVTGRAKCRGTSVLPGPGAREPRSWLGQVPRGLGHCPPLVPGGLGHEWAPWLGHWATTLVNQPQPLTIYRPPASTLQPYGNIHISLKRVQFPLLWYISILILLVLGKLKANPLPLSYAASPLFLLFFLFATRPLPKRELEKT